MFCFFIRTYTWRSIAHNETFSKGLLRKNVKIRNDFHEDACGPDKKTGLLLQACFLELVAGLEPATC